MRLILILLLFSSCSLLKDRTVDKVNEKVKFSDRSTITEKEPGDVIIMPAPLTPKDRPRNTTITTKGANGTTVTTNYDKEGFVAGQVVVAPPKEKIEQRDIEGEIRLKTKQVESKANIDLANVIGKWTATTLIPIGFFFAVAFYLKR